MHANGSMRREVAASVRSGGGFGGASVAPWREVQIEGDGWG